MPNFAVKLVLGRTHYAKQYLIYDYLRDYSASGNWSVVTVSEDQDWRMHIMFGYTTIYFKEYIVYRKLRFDLKIKDDYKLFELNSSGNFVKIEDTEL